MLPQDSTRVKKLFRSYFHDWYFIALWKLFSLFVMNFFLFLNIFFNFCRASLSLSMNLQISVSYYPFSFKTLFGVLSFEKNENVSRSINPFQADIYVTTAHFRLLSWWLTYFYAVWNVTLKSISWILYKTEWPAL